MRAIAIFGAAVRPDGSPSPALARRIGYGLRAAAAEPGTPVFCSGGAGAAGPSEASVMAGRLIALGLDPARLVMDEASLDTLQSVVALARFIRAEGLKGAVVCTDAYHQPRVGLMLSALGVASAPGPVQRGPAGGLAYWTRMTLREGLAIPYDLAIVLARRRSLLRAIAEG